MSEAQRDELRRKEMGFVFQSIALISMMSAYENVEFALRVAGYKASERRQRAEECFAFVGLTKRMHHRPGELSGGGTAEGSDSKSYCPSSQSSFCR